MIGRLRTKVVCTKLTTRVGSSASAVLSQDNLPSQVDGWFILEPENITIAGICDTDVETGAEFWLELVPFSSPEGERR